MRKKERQLEEEQEAKEVRIKICQTNFAFSGSSGRSVGSREEAGQRPVRGGGDAGGT